jgi:hypothetical protein
LEEGRSDVLYKAHKMQFYKKNTPRPRSLLQIRREKRKGALCLISLCKDKEHVTKHPTYIFKLFSPLLVTKKNKWSSSSCVYLDTSQEHNRQQSIQCHWNLHLPKEQAVPYQPDLSIKVNSASLQLLQEHQVWLVHHVPMLVGGVWPPPVPSIVIFKYYYYYYYLLSRSLLPSLLTIHQPSIPTFWWETFVLSTLVH